MLADYELERRHEAILLTALEALGQITTDGYGRVGAHPCVVDSRRRP